MRRTAVLMLTAGILIACGEQKEAEAAIRSDACFVSNHYCQCTMRGMNRVSASSQPGKTPNRTVPARQTVRLKW